MNIQKNGKGKKYLLKFLTFALISTLCFATFAFADGYMGEVKKIVDGMVDVIGNIFRTVGVILAVYAVGTLVLAFKNEDADSKSRASTLLVVSIVLISFPSIVKGLNLTDNIK